VPIFRALFAAQLGSNIGNWMETVGAQWILVHHPRAETLVALVQTADMLPFMFLALPAGVFADLFDRRRYLIFVHLFLAATSGALAAATFASVIAPATLLAVTFLEQPPVAVASRSPARACLRSCRGFGPGRRSQPGQRSRDQRPCLRRGRISTNDSCRPLRTDAALSDGLTPHWETGSVWAARPAG
jgi:MFS family permease